MTSNTTRQFGITLPNGNANINSIVTEDGNTFFNATELWKLAGSDVSNKPVEFLRSEEAQNYIHYRWEKLNENKGLVKGAMVAPFNFTPNKALPAEVTAPFVITTKGRKGATWMDYNVFVDYAQYLSAEFKDTLIETFKHYGFIYTAPANKQTELLVEVARQHEVEMIAKAEEIDFENLTRKDRVKIFAKASARIKQMETTGHLKALITEIYGANDQAMVSSIFKGIFGAINRNLFGYDTKVLANGLGGSYSREYLSSSSLRAVNAIELELCQFIEDAMEDGEWVGISELAGIAGSIAKKARKNILFRNGKKTRVIAERLKSRTTKVKGEESLRGYYEVELESNKQIFSLYTPLDKDKE